MHTHWRLLALALLVIMATGCLPAYPRPAPGPGWNRHVVAKGDHSASVRRGSRAPEPLLGFTRKPGRNYHLIFDSSARYTITDPVQPDDQLDWNKLPGLSDCGDIDLAQNGLMFGWRWRTDLTPRVLEITAYANRNGEHVWSDEPLLSLNRAQVDAEKPIRFRLRISDDRRSYLFTVRARIGGQEVVRSDRIDRACPHRRRDLQKWAGGFYFGGTSTAPRWIQAHIFEPR